MASSSPCDCDCDCDCDCWSHLSDSSSLSQTPSSSVWNHTKLSSLSNPTVDFHLNHSSSFLNSSSSASLPSHKTTHQDQRHMRILRNRESAVRSRARKQAYRKGLEAEVVRLTEENSRLRSQLEELQRCMWSFDEAPRKKAPCRTSSSPF
ncbi:protein FD [Cajanus cajan]|uniref:Protein FD n=1 Tax=Cajanus cajan TaxID=3821 RepID=A0A151RUT6_CAJCA|nr:protein FD [Cajanus cajan]KYP46308.1 Protein FD [Cajanus cajan]